MTVSTSKTTGPFCWKLCTRLWLCLSTSRRNRIIRNHRKIIYGTRRRERTGGTSSTISGSWSQSLSITCPWPLTARMPEMSRTSSTKPRRKLKSSSINFAMSWLKIGNNILWTNSRNSSSHWRIFVKIPKRGRTRCSRPTSHCCRRNSSTTALATKRSAWKQPSGSSAKGSTLSTCSLKTSL